MSVPNPCAFWRWRGRGSTWSFLLSWRCRFYQVVLPLTKLATICSWRAPKTAYCCGYQVGIKAFWPWNTSLLRTFQVEVWKKFSKVYPQKVSITRVCIKTLWTNNTVRWISGGETSWGKTLAVFFCRWARQLNDTIILPCAFFCELKKFLPTTSWQDIVEASLRTVLSYGWANDQITKVHSLSLIPILRDCSSYVEVDSAREYWTVSVCRQFLEDGGLFQWNSLKFTDEFCLCALKSAPSFSSHTSGLDEMLTEGGFGWGEILRLTDSEKSDGIKSESLILTGFWMGLFEGWTWLGWKCHEGTTQIVAKSSQKVDHWWFWNGQKRHIKDGS